MEYAKQLASFGLNDKEAKIYLALLSINRATAYYIALKSGLKKPTTYVILEDLVKKGFVLKIPQDKKSLYMAKSPQDCFSIVQEKIDEAREILPELMAIQKKDDKVSVSYFEGLEGLKEVYRDTLKYPKEFLAFGSENMADVLGNEWMDEFIGDRIKKGIAVKAIVPKTDYYEKNLLEKDSQQLRTMKFIDPTEFPFSVEIDVYGDSKVSLISARDSVATIIESEDVHKTMRSIFELLWKKLPDSTSSEN